MKISEVFFEYNLHHYFTYLNCFILAIDFKGVTERVFEKFNKKLLKAKGLSIIKAMFSDKGLLIL